METLVVKVYGDYTASELHKRIKGIGNSIRETHNTSWHSIYEKERMALWAKLFKLGAKVDIRVNSELLSKHVIIPTFAKLEYVDALESEVEKVKIWESVIKLIWNIKGVAVDAEFDFFYMDYGKHFVTFYDYDGFQKYGLIPRKPNYMTM